MTPLAAALAVIAPAASAAGVPLAWEPAAPLPAIVHNRENPCADDAPADEDFPDERKDCAGKTRARFKPRMALSWDFKEEGKDATLIWLDEIKVVPPDGMTSPLQQTIEISSSYQKDTCPYKVTVAHEQKHYQDNVDAYEKGMKELQERIRGLRLPTKDQPERIPQSQTAVDNYQNGTGRMLYGIVNSKRKEIAEAMRAAVAKRDSADEYLKNDWSKCPPKDWKANTP